MMSELYWIDGPARMRLYHNPELPEEIVSAAVSILDDFRSQCQRLWFAFDGMVNGRPLALQRFKEMNASRNNSLSVGTQFPDQEQSLGKSTFAQITFGDLFDAMAKGGEFEQLNARADIVFMDALWEDSTRKRVADVLQLDIREVKCDLLADLRRLRNIMIHQSEKAKQDYVEKATLLPQIWTIDTDNVSVTAPMLQSLIEQLNALKAYAGPSV